MDKVIKGMTEAGHQGGGCCEQSKQQKNDSAQNKPVSNQGAVGDERKDNQEKIREAFK